MSLFSFLTYRPKSERRFSLLKPAEKNAPSLPAAFSGDIDEMLKTACLRYHVGENKDVVVRRFSVRVGFQKKRAALFFFDGMVDNERIDAVILKGLMIESEKVAVRNTQQLIGELLPEGQLCTERFWENAVQKINLGFCLLLIDGEPLAYLLDVKKWEHRGIDAAENERSILGPKQAFNESLLSNTVLIRRLIRSESLVVYHTQVGSLTKTPCSILYMDGIVNPGLVDEVKRRIAELQIETLISSHELEQFIEENSSLALPQMLSTEKPDRAARALLEGRVVVVVDGSPFAIIMPVTLSDLEASGEDPYLRYPFRLFGKIIRTICFFLSVFFPAGYLAVVTFHSEVLPTDMLIALVGALEHVPFTTLTELLFLEIAFEIIRQASVVTPNSMGSTLGIVGALILGQAAVSANLVDPVLIIIVSITGISSFCIPNYSLAYTNRLLKFLYIFLAYTGGFLGLACGGFIHILIWSTTTSFGVPMLAPFSPDTGEKHAFLSVPIWKNEQRPRYVKPRKTRQQAPIARRWLFGKE